MDISRCSTSGSCDFSGSGDDFSGSGSGDGDYVGCYQPLTCSAHNGIKSEAIIRKFEHLMQNIYKARKFVVSHKQKQEKK